MAFKNTLIRCITVVLCVIALSITTCVGAGKISTAKIEAAKQRGTVSTSDGASDDGTISDDGSTPNGSTDDGSTPADGTDASGDTTSADGNGASSDGTTKAPVVNGTTAKPTSSVPKTAAEIVSYYNTATAKVVSSKAGYTKARITDNEQIEANAIVKSFKTLIYKFMGIGDENKYAENVTKGSWGDKAYFLASKLTTSDVTSASCTNSNGVYTITMKLKGGSSSAGKSNPTTAANSSLDKSGICVGTEDKGYFDHKTASVIYDAIQGTSAGAEVSESYSNATVKATINSATGQITGLTVEWNCSVTISKFLGMTASATGISHVNYSNFKF